MANVRLIAELGSCHMGKIEYLKEAIELCDRFEIPFLKVQLFPNEEKYTSVGNVYLSPDLYLEAKAYADQLQVGLSASVFDEKSFEFLLETEPSFIKFAFSKKEKRGWIEETLSRGIEAIVSCDVMSRSEVPDGATKLFCIARYPIYEKLHFDNLFPLFDGFSDHTLGIEQTLEAATSGARTIEKHFRLSHAEINCPDSLFSISPGELSHLQSELTRLSEVGLL